VAAQMHSADAAGRFNKGSLDCRMGSNERLLNFTGGIGPPV
jgi:hypothetical protein